MTFSPLPAEFYAPSAEAVAPLLLGHFLLRRVETAGGQTQWVGGEIVETEAYIVGDPACHAYVRQTQRNASMFGRAGLAYVYRIYGSYRCINAVCRETGVAEAVLIRAIEPRFGIETMRELRPEQSDIGLTNGPSKLCIAQNITSDLDGADLTNPDSPLLIAQNPQRDAFFQNRAPLVQTTRIGITKAADWPFRWYLGGSKWVSVREKLKKTVTKSGDSASHLTNPGAP